MFDLYRHFTFLITASYPKGYSCKYPNCPGFIGRALVSGILSRCPWLVQFILVFRFFYQKNLYINLIFFTSSEQTYANKCISIIIYSDLYLECYKKNNNSFGYNKSYFENIWFELLGEIHSIWLQTSEKLFRNFLYKTICWKHYNRR